LLFVQLEEVKTLATSVLGQWLKTAVAQVRGVLR